MLSSLVMEHPGGVSGHAMWIDALLAFCRQDPKRAGIVDIKGYLKLETREVCHPVPALICLLGTGVLRALLEAEGVFPRAGPGL